MMSDAMLSARDNDCFRTFLTAAGRLTNGGLGELSGVGDKDDTDEFMEELRENGGRGAEGAACLPEVAFREADRFGFDAARGTRGSGAPDGDVRPEKEESWPSSNEALQRQASTLSSTGAPAPGRCSKVSW
ncbi:hypothetical protein DIPPA_09632 [Diplonema papillatum]|nr:hypothetical protein DIPPA_09632 [Diplonema papillatum]